MDNLLYFLFLVAFFFGFSSLKAQNPQTITIKTDSVEYAISTSSDTTLVSVEVQPDEIEIIKEIKTILFSENELTGVKGEKPFKFRVKYIYKVENNEIKLFYTLLGVEKTILERESVFLEKKIWVYQN